MENDVRRVIGFPDGRWQGGEWGDAGSHGLTNPQSQDELPLHGPHSDLQLKSQGPMQAAGPRMGAPGWGGVGPGLACLSLHWRITGASRPPY